MTEANRSTNRPARRVNARRVKDFSFVATGGLVAASLGAPDASANDGASAPAAVAQLYAQASAGGGEGEGEGEGEGGGKAALATEEGYLAALAYIEGHLRAGIALYRVGAARMAETHMKHPKDEIYASLLPALKRRGAEPFGDALAELAEAVEGGAPVERAEAAFRNLMERLDAAREKAEDTEMARLKSLPLIVRKAAEEYAIAVKDGQLVNTHEYQDAWGFMASARAQARMLTESGDEAVAEAAEQALGHMDATDELFDGLAPLRSIGTDPSVLHGAAARVELAVLEAQ